MTLAAIRLPLLILLLWMAGLGAAGQFAKIGVILPELSVVYPGHGAAIGFLLSIISIVGVVFGLIAGAMLGRVGARRLLVGALLLGSFVSLFQFIIPSFPVIMASRILEGLSHLGIVVAAPTLIASLTPIRYRGLTMSLWGTFFGVAFAVTAWAGIPLVHHYGPGALFVAHGVFTGLTAIALARLLPAQLPTTSQHAASSESLDMGSLIRRHHQVYASPHIAAPAFGWLFYAVTFISLLTVLPTLMPAEDRSQVASAMPLASIVVSMTLGVILQRVMQAVHVVALGFGTAILATSLFLFLPAQPWMAITLMGTMGLVQGASFAAIPQLNANPVNQALANGGMAQTGNLGNLIGTPLLLSVLSLAGIQSMIIVVMCLFALGLVAHLMSARARFRLAAIANI